jgi:hypothetical protein
MRGSAPQSSRITASINGELKPQWFKTVEANLPVFGRVRETNKKNLQISEPYAVEG